MQLQAELHAEMLATALCPQQREQLISPVRGTRGRGFGGGARTSVTIIWALAKVEGTKSSSESK